MTLMISLLLLAWHVGRNESPPFMLSFYFLVPLLSYFDMTQIPLLASTANMTQFWYLGAASVLVGIALSADAYYFKNKNVKLTKEGFIFFGITSLYSPLAFLFSAALMVLLKNWFLYSKRSRHPKNSSWMLLVSFLIACHVLGENQSSVDSVFIESFLALLVVLLIAGFSFPFFLAALSLNVMLFPFEFWPSYAHHTVSAFILIGVFLSASDLVKEKLTEKFGKYRFWKKMVFLTFQANNPPVLSRPKQTNGSGIAMKRGGVKKLAEPTENIFWQSASSMLFLLIGIVLLGFMGGLYN